jgi:hypothetical protein
MAALARKPDSSRWPKTQTPVIHIMICFSPSVCLLWFLIGQVRIHAVRKMRRIRLVLTVFLVLLIPSGLPVVTRHAAALLRAEGKNCCPEDAQILPLLREAGQLHRATSLGATTADAGLSKGFWGDKGSEEVLIRRAGLASKRAKQPRKVATNKPVRTPFSSKH